MTETIRTANRGGNLRGLFSAMPGPLWAAIYVGIAAATLPAVLPVMVGVLADQLGFGLVHAGYAASANMGGVALGSVMGAVLTRRWSWATVIIVGAAVMIGANVLTMAGTAFPYVAAMRLTSGLGEGFIASICYAAMGRSGQPARALAFYAAGQGLVGAAGMGFMTTVVQLAGWQVLFVLVSVLALPAFWLARPIGTLQGGEEIAATTARSGHLPLLGWATVGALAMQFIGMSAIWSFLERLGHAKGIDPFHLSFAMSATAIASMTGSLAVGLFAHRVRGLQGIAGAFGVFVISIAGLLLWTDWRVFLLAGVFFMLSWAVYFPFQFGLLAEFDRGGRLAAIMPAVTGAAFTVGPAIGGVLMAKGGASGILTWGFACMSVSSLVCVALYQLSRRISGRPT